MNELRIPHNEIIECRSEYELRLLLSSKGLPMLGLFWPKLDTKNYRFRIEEDDKTFERIYFFQEVETK